MPRFVPLTDFDRQGLRDLQSLTGLSQKELADRISTVNITQPWISQMLGGSRSSVDPDILEAYANQLVLALKNKPFDDQFNVEARRDAFSFLGRFTQSPALKESVEVTRPGGAVRTDAIYYQAPPEESELNEALQITPFSMLVQGPVHCGKSSLLARLERCARSTGFETAWFDPVLPLGHLLDRSERLPVSTSAVASALYEQVQDQWSLEPRREGTPETIRHLLNWFIRVLKPNDSKSRLLVIDDLSILGLDGLEEWTSLFIRPLNNYALLESISFSVAVEMRYVYGEHFTRRMVGISSLLNWSPLVDLQWLSMDQANRLVNSLDPESLAHNPYQHFLGQPYLTHSFAADKDFQEASIKWFNEPNNPAAIDGIRQTKTYRRHRGAIRATFAGRVLRLSDAQIDFIEAFSKMSQLDDDRRNFLEKARLIKPNANEHMIPLYRYIAADLADEKDRGTQWPR